MRLLLHMKADVTATDLKGKRQAFAAFMPLTKRLARLSFMTHVR